MKALYQTLEDKNNADYVEEHGPFFCGDKNAWLGQGYYFWETFIEYAKWWGEVRYHQGGYIICESKLDFKRIKILDLVDTNTLMDIKEIGGKWYSDWKECPTVPQIIEFMKSDSYFNYQAIRARVENATKESYLPDHRVFFNTGYGAYLDMMPQIQVCVLDKRVIGKDNFHIVYPLDYVV